MSGSYRAPGALERIAGPRFAVLAMLALAATAAVYWPGLDGPLILDDVSALEPLSAMARGELSGWEVIASSEAGPTGRPLAMASFVADWMVHGGSVRGLKLTNLGIHLATGAVLWLLCQGLLATPRAAVPEPARHWIALWIMVAWLLTPMMVSTVLYTVQRMAALAALFSLAALALYVRARFDLRDRPRRAAALLGCALMLAWPLALASKENALILPWLVLTVEWFFFDSDHSPRVRRLRLALLVPVALPLIAVAGRLALDPAWLAADYAARGLGPIQRALTEAGILWDYVANLLVLPFGTPFGLYRDDIVPARSLFDPPLTALAVALWGVVIIACLAGRRRAHGVLGFGPVFFLAAHVVESTVAPLELYFEHRNYLPAAGLFIAAGIGGYRLHRATRLGTLMVIALALVPTVYGALTAQRVDLWRQWDAIVMSSVRNHPGSPRAHTAAASLFINRYRFERGFEHLDEAQRLYGGEPRLALVLHRLSAYCIGDREVPESEYARLDAVGPVIDVYLANVATWLVGAHEHRRCASLDIDRIGEAIERVVTLAETMARARRHSEVRPVWNLHVALGKLHALNGRTGASLTHLQRAMTLRPHQLAPGLLAAETAIEAGLEARARELLARLEAGDTGRIRAQTEAVASLRARLSR